MSRIAGCFEGLRSAGRKGLATFITAGDPDAATTVALMHALVDAGADLVELGVPFSDPMADGPVIQRASERALAGGASLGAVLDMVGEFRERDARTPVVLMGYLNPIEVMGYAEFAARAAAVGVDGVLTVDLPPEEAAAAVAEFGARELDPIFLLAPTSSAERVKRVCVHASGFVYYVSVKGVTGSATLDVAAIAEGVQRIRAATAVPVAVGFGISDGAAAARVAKICDVVVVGSAIVGRVERAGSTGDDPIAAASALVVELRAALDAHP